MYVIPASSGLKVEARDQMLKSKQVSSAWYERFKFSLDRANKQAIIGAFGVYKRTKPTHTNGPMIAKNIL